VLTAVRAAGWLATSGERFRIEAAPGIRLTASALANGEAPEIADTIARVEHARRPRRVY
jgi:hypothetical protein